MVCVCVFYYFSLTSIQRTETLLKWSFSAVTREGNDGEVSGSFSYRCVSAAILNCLWHSLFVDSRMQRSRFRGTTVCVFWMKAVNAMPSFFPCWRFSAASNAISKAPQPQQKKRWRCQLCLCVYFFFFLLLQPHRRCILELIKWCNSFVWLLIMSLASASDYECG